ncbi:hypothetical protein PVK06_035612 [Gossypium arboreum]|uniref:Uncharacterized protein n=1 Tax=Gossypium arboreum TaxID=29729 RepID=A0ABR0NJD5_GOSAR|nr:hypothetical protein PVK06_035612 [Gossypium arboreum]
MERPFFFYDTCGIHPCHWNIILYSTTSAPSPDQANSPIVVARSFSPSHASSTSLPTPATNMDALALLDAVQKNEGVVAAPSRTMDDRTQKRPKVKGSTQDTEGNNWPQLTYCRLRRRPAHLRAITPPAFAISSTPVVSEEHFSQMDGNITLNA